MELKKSKCCNAHVIIKGHTTKYFACKNCGKPCQGKIKP